MADEIVSVGIKIETTGADSAAASLDKVVSAGGKVDAAATQITAGAGKASKSLESLGATAATVAPQLDKAGSSGGKLGDLFKQATDGAGAFSGSLGLVKAGLVGAVTALSVQSVVELGKSFLRTADAITNLNSQLKLATGSAAAAKDAYEGLFSVAQRSRVGFVELGNTYAQIARATDGLGLSASSSLRIVETLGKAITISGVSAGSASAAMIQLSQGLSSGTLRGEELNSILEQTPRVARAIADGLGVSIGQLRTMGSEGKLTAEAVSGALLKASATIDKEFGSVATTVSQAMTVMGNATTKAVGDFDSIVGVSSAVATGILSIVSAAGQLKDMFAGSWTGQAVAALAAMRQKVTENRDNPTIEMLQAQLDAASKRSDSFKGTGFGDVQAKASAERYVAQLQERIRKLETDEWDKAAKQVSESADKMILDYNRVKAAGDKFIEDKDNQTKPQQKESAFAKLRTEFAAATKDLREGSAEYLRVYAAFLTGKDNIAEKFDKKEKVDKSGASKAKADAEAYAVAIAAGEKQVALLQAQADARRPLTELEKVAIELATKEEELARKNGTSRMAEVKAIDEETLALLRTIQAQKDEQAVIASNFAGAIAIAEAREKSRDALIDQAATVEASVRALKLEAEAIGVTGVALAYLTNRRIDDQIVAMQAKRDLSKDDEEVAAINRVIRALEAEKEARLDIARKTATVDARKQVEEDAKKSTEAWQKASDQISQGLTDALFRAAESGKSFFTTLRDSIKGMFNNLVLKPIIQATVSATGQLVSGALGLAGGGGGTGGGSGILGLASNALSIYNAVGTSGGVLGSAGAYGLATGTSAFGGATSQAAMLAAQTGEFGASGLWMTAQAASGVSTAAATAATAAATTAEAAAAAVTAAELAGASAAEIAVASDAAITAAAAAETASAAAGAGEAALAGAGPYGWIALAVIAAAAYFGVGSGGGGPKTGGSAIIGGNVTDRLFTPSDQDALARSIVAGAYLSAKSLAAQLGGQFTGSIALGLDQDPSGDAGTRIASRVIGNSGRTVLDNVASRTVGSTPEEVTKELALETKRVFLAALQDSGLQNGFEDIFKRLDANTATAEQIDQLVSLAETLYQVGEAASRLPGVMSTIADMSATSRKGLIGLAGGLEKLQSNLQSYYENFFTPEEQLANAGRNLTTGFAKIGLSFDALAADSDGPRQAFRDLVEGLGPITDANKDAFAALIAINPELVQWLNAMDAIAEATRQANESIDQAFLTDAQKLGNVLGDLGLEMPRTAAEFESMVRAQDIATESGREAVGSLLSVRAAFDAVQQSARDAANAVIRQALESSRASVASEMDALTRANGDLSRTLFDLENPIRTTSERFLELGQNIQATMDRMGQILGTGAVSLLDHLQAAVDRRSAVAGARTGIAGQIQDLTIQGFANRKDFRGGINFLKGIESALFAELQTTTDPAGVAGQITQAITSRYQFEANLIGEADALRQKSLEKEISRLEQLVDIADRLKETIVDLQTGSLSALAPQAQVSIAASAFGSTLNRAQGGDLKALQALPGEATRFLTEQQSFTGSGGNYATIFSNVISGLESVGMSLSDAPTQLSLAQGQLTATTTVADNTGEMIVDLRTLDTALAARSTAETDAINALAQAIRDEIALDAERRDEIRVQWGHEADRWTSLGVTLQGIEDRLGRIADNATMAAAA